MAKIYVASSWRNKLQQHLVKLLRSHGHWVYDFKHPTENAPGFSWADIDPQWQKWNVNQIRANLSHPKANRGFAKDFNAMNNADVCVLLLPCGRSAHAEAGYMAGKGKKVVALITEPQEAELMYKLFDKVVGDTDDLVCYLDSLDNKHRQKFNAIILAGGLNTLIETDDGFFVKLLRVKPCWIKKMFSLNNKSQNTQNGTQEETEIPNSLIKSWRDNNMTIDSLLQAGTIIPRNITHVKFGRDISEPPAFYRLVDVKFDFGNPDWGAPKNEKVFILTIGQRDDNVTGI